MPNKNAPVCACGVVVDLPKARNSSIIPRKLTIFVPKSKGKKSEAKSSRKQQQQQQDDGQGPKNQTSRGEIGSSSSMMEPSRSMIKNNKHEKRLTESRRTRSAERVHESHYTYIDSGSSILGGAVRENTMPEPLYATIPDDIPSASISETGTGQSNSQNRFQPVYAIPSMTSPPPTYDVAIAKTWQTGLPPTYEEYLCHKYAMLSRSHTPPPSWSDSMTSQSPYNPTSSIRIRRDLLASHPELREYLARLTLAQNSDRALHYQQQSQSRDTATCSSNQQQILREQQVRAQQRTRAMPPRSQSEGRAQQKQMYNDAAFCMETTVLQSAYDQGFAMCTLM